MKKEDPPIVVEETYASFRAEVWSAITEIDRMRVWYFDNIPAFEPVVGFETRFPIRSEGRNFLHMWKVTEVVPGERIRYGWKFEEYPGDSFVLWELFDEGSGTRLRLTVEVLDSFPEGVPELTRECCVGGWEFFLGQRLKGYLEGGR